jgi:hypothetical protein
MRAQAERDLAEPCRARDAHYRRHVIKDAERTERDPTQRMH